MDKYCVKIDDKRYCVEIDKVKKQENVQTSNSSVGLCYEAIKAEYDYCVQRAEKLESKVNILLAACAFLFALLAAVIDKAGQFSFPVTIIDLIWILVYSIFLVGTIGFYIFMMFKLVGLLKSIRMARLDSGNILIKGLPDESEITTVKYIGLLYVQHTTENNALIETRYTEFNKCINLFLVNMLLLIVLALICTLAL